ncbi:hypothetical protein ACVWXO_001708 [Bradyrhizobium sp. LM2.7]
MEDVHTAKQLELVRRVAARLGDRKAPGQGVARGLAATAREHQGQSESGLEVHFRGTAARGRINRKQRPLGPAPALDEQGHRQKDWCRGGCESDSDAGVAAGPKTPVQRGAYIVKCGKMDHAFVGARHRRPCRAGLFQPSPVVVGVAGSECSFVSRDLEQIGARRVQQAVAHHRADRSRRHHRLGDEAVDGFKQPSAVDAFVRYDLERGVNGEMPGEDCKPAQHEAFDVGQELVAPVQRSLQRLLPRRRGTLTLPEQVEAFIQQRRGLLQAIGFDPAGGELDRQGHAVELAADTSGDGGIGIVERDLRAAGSRAFEKQFQRGIGLRDGGRQSGAIGWNGKRRQSIDLLALDAQSFPAGGQDMNLRRGPKYLCSQRRGRRDDVLAIVQDQQQLLVMQMRKQGGHRIVGLRRQAEHQQDRGDHEIGIAERGKIDEMRGIGERLEQVVGDRHGNCGLADAARADDRDEARRDEFFRQGSDRIVSPDHPLQPVRKFDGRQFRPARRAALCGTTAPRDRRHEAIAAPGQRCDVAGAVLAVAQSFPKRRDVKAQVRFLDEHAGPDQLHQLQLADHLVRPRHQCDQRIEALGAERQHDALARHEPLLRRHGEWPER